MLFDTFNTTYEQSYYIAGTHVPVAANHSSNELIIQEPTNILL